MAPLTLLGGVIALAVGEGGFFGGSDWDTATKNSAALPAIAAALVLGGAGRSPPLQSRVEGRGRGRRAPRPHRGVPGHRR
nr:hypothetical protein GCM10010200_039980 [Actinomadura rugatobispora]